MIFSCLEGRVTKISILHIPNWTKATQNDIVTDRMVTAKVDVGALTGNNKKGDNLHCRGCSYLKGDSTGGNMLEHSEVRNGELI